MPIHKMNKSVTTFIHATLFVSRSVQSDFCRNRFLSISVFYFSADKNPTDKNRSAQTLLWISLRHTCLCLIEPPNTNFVPFRSSTWLKYVNENPVNSLPYQLSSAVKLKIDSKGESKAKATDWFLIRDSVLNYNQSTTTTTKWRIKTSKVFLFLRLLRYSALSPSIQKARNQMESRMLGRVFICRASRKSSATVVRTFVATVARTKIPEITTSAVSLSLPLQYPCQYSYCMPMLCLRETHFLDMKTMKPPHCPIHLTTTFVICYFIIVSLSMAYLEPMQHNK